MTEQGKVKADQYRSIHTSKPFPPLCFGVPYNLDPKVRKDIEKAFETFSFEGNKVGEAYAAQKRVKFAKVDYKKDFENVREIDAKLTHLFDPN
jgi:phosphonate transport system substrate-binding protein